MLVIGLKRLINIKQKYQRKNVPASFNSFQKLLAKIRVSQNINTQKRY
jgi:hypothetical protein